MRSIHAMYLSLFSIHVSRLVLVFSFFAPISVAGLRTDRGDDDDRLWTSFAGMSASSRPLKRRPSSARG